MGYLLQHLKQCVRQNYFEVLGRISPERLAKLHYRRAFKKEMDLDHPQDINEKINWLKFRSDTTEWVRLADKYRVREYVEACGLGDTLVKLYGKWDRVEDVDWASLPNQFVMKMNNGSGDVFICTDKSQTSFEQCVRHFAPLFKQSFGVLTAEPHYRQIKPCVIAEELLDVSTQPCGSTSLIDYKIWCFDGTPLWIWVGLNRHDGYAEDMLYDTDWVQHAEHLADVPHYRITEKSVPRPQNLARMLEVAATLSKGFPQLRLDLYEVAGKIYFGEMTFTSSGGYDDGYTLEFLLELGQHCDLNKAPKKPCK